MRPRNPVRGIDLRVEAQIRQTDCYGRSGIQGALDPRGFAVHSGPG